MFKQLSIPQRLILVSTVASAAALLIASFIFLAYDRVSYRTFLIDGITTQADVVGTNSISAIVFSDPDSARATIAGLRKNPLIESASLFTADRRFFAGWSLTPQLAVRAMPNATSQITNYEFHGEELLLSRKLLLDDKPVATLVIRADFSVLNRRLKNFVMIALLIVVMSVLTAFILSSLLQRTLTRAIVNLSDTARSISRDRNFSIRATPPGSTDEIGILVDTFNEMLSAIQARDFALSSERARLRTILENAPIGILVVEAPSRQIILSNRKFEEMMGTPIRDLKEVPRYYTIMRPDRSVISPPDWPLSRALSNKEFVRGEENLVRREDRSETWVRASAAPVLDDAGKVLAAVLVLSELDDQKKAQEALLRSEKLAAAGRLAASISHEINNPLEGVINLLYIALSDETLSAHTRAQLQLADQELARVSHIATQSLRFYRQSSRPTKCNVSVLLDSVLDLLVGKLRNVDVQVTRDFQTQGSLVCFEGELRQVFMNLLSNSLDAMAGRGGRLFLRVKSVSAGKRRGLQVAVADTGQGIDPETLSFIFEPFYTTKGNLGTGLGLWVTRDIVDKHSGSIRVRSKKGQGTVFLVFLPEDGVALPLSDSARSA